MSLKDKKTGSGQKEETGDSKSQNRYKNFNGNIFSSKYIIELKKNKKYKSRKQKDRKTRQKDNKTRQKGIKEKKMKEPEIKFRKVKEIEMLKLPFFTF